MQNLPRFTDETATESQRKHEKSEAPMSAPSELKSKLREKIDSLSIQDKNRNLLRVAIGVFTLTLALFASLTTYYTRRVLSQAAQLTKTLAILVLVYGVYIGLSRVISVPIIALSKSAFNQLSKRGPLPVRVANVATVLTIVAATYIAYRIMRWSVQPVLDRLKPDMEQTDMSTWLEHSKEVHKNKTIDPPEGSMAEEILNR